MSLMKQVWQICQDNDITFDQFNVMYHIEDKPVLTKIVDKIVNFYELHQNLQRRGLVKFMSGDMDNYNRIEYIMLTEKGQEIVDSFIDTEYVENTPDVDFVDEYRNIFSPAKSSGGRPIKGSKAACSKKLERFMKEHKDISKEDILQAAKNYITKMSKQNYSYVTCADYFIYKRKNDGVEVSLLEAEVELVKEGHIESSTDEFTVKL
jgi:DNA-binding MarR family transcriptional regulator